MPVEESEKILNNRKVYINIRTGPACPDICLIKVCNTRILELINQREKIMIKEYWNQVLQNQDIRQNLSKIRQELKISGNREVLLYAIAGQEDRLITLLQAEDAKTRKNAALLMGDLGSCEFLEPIYCAYEKEQQQFVKSSYLSAMENFDCRQYIDKLKERLNILSGLSVPAENQKHHMEEIRALSALVISMEGVKTHKFTGWEETYDAVLLTNRSCAEVTRGELQELLPEAKTKLFGAGVLARVKNLNWIEDIRTYHELLFSLNKMKPCPMEPLTVAEAIINSDLMAFLGRGHEGNPPFYFRVELKSKRQLDAKSTFVKKVSGHLEQLSERKLVNTTSNYEIELRLIENKDGNCNLLVKLFTLKDDRFAYRKEVMPTSLKPVDAALAVALAKEYMKENAQVLDPFCGVGTMIIERHKAVRANTTYGIDRQEEAIIKARENTEAAHQIIHYINRDFFTFEHEYLFDEVITNMPFQIGRITEEEVYELYADFFKKIPKHLSEDGLLILYSHNKDYVTQMGRENHFKILKEYEISKKKDIYVIILRYIKNHS